MKEEQKFKGYLRVSPDISFSNLDKKVDIYEGDVFYGDYRIEDLYLVNSGFTIYSADLIPINIAHFHGNSLPVYKEFQELIFSSAEISFIPEPLELITCWTEPEKCMILQQLDKFGFGARLINACPADIDSSSWYMPNKIKYYIEALKKSTRPIVLLMDGYDTMIINFEDMLRKFRLSGKRILFNATRNNYPNIDIDYVPYRRLRGLSKYFNAGCCIGYREDVLRFYEECLDYIDLPNPYNSEQFILRHAFSKYSCKVNNSFIDFDYKNDIFQLFCKTAISKRDDLTYIVL